MSIELVMPSNHLILSHPLLLLPSVFPSIRVFSNESVLCITWPKYWSFRVSPFNEYSGLISFRSHWFDLTAVQGALESLLQHHSSKSSTLQGSAFFIMQRSHPYMTTRKTVALTIWTLKDREFPLWSLLPIAAFLYFQLTLAPNIDILCVSVYVCMLSHVRLFATPWLEPTRLLCPWNFSVKNTGVDCHFLLQGIFLTQRSNPCLLCWQVDSLSLSHLGSQQWHSTPLDNLESPNKGHV